MPVDISDADRRELVPLLDNLISSSDPEICRRAQWLKWQLTGHDPFAHLNTRVIAAGREVLCA